MFIKKMILSLIFAQTSFAANDCGSVLADHVSSQVNAINDLGWSIAGDMAAASKGENIVYSPFSTSAAMQMAVLGATGDNRKEMLQVMGLSEEDLTFGFKGLTASLFDVPMTYDYEKGGEKPAYEINVANAVWTNDTQASVSAKYREFVMTHYGAEAQAIPFNDDGVSMVNKWVEAQTNELIKDLISSLNNDDRAVLTNAIRVKANWQTPFHTEEKKDFYSPTGTVQVNTMMSKKSEGIYVSAMNGVKYKGVALAAEGSDAKGNSKLKMYVIVPKDISPEELMSNPGRLEQHMNEINQDRPQATHVEMPSFKIKSDDMELVPSFEKLGMEDAFVAQKGNFDLLLEGDPEALKISKIIQKAVIEVNKNGFEAAAATAVIITAESAIQRPDPERQMIVDSPFVYVVRDESVGVNLFVGVVNNPAGE